MFFFSCLSQNEKNKNPKTQNESKLGKMDVYCSKLSQDIVNTELN